MRAVQSFVPDFRLFSGRRGGFSRSESTELIENRIARAVTVLQRALRLQSVQTFPLVTSVDPIGRHVDRLAATLDTLSRQHGILFIVSAGNFKGTENCPQDWRGEYRTISSRTMLA